MSKFDKNKNKTTKFQKQKLQQQSKKVSNIKPNSVLASLIKSDNIIISKESLSNLDLTQTMQLINELAQFIIVAPDRNITHLHTLFHLCESDNIVVVKASLFSIAEIIKDVCPLYEIKREEVDVRMKQQLSKAERFQVNFEFSFLEFYEKYLNLAFYFSKIKTKKILKSFLGSSAAADAKEKEQLSERAHKIKESFNVAGTKCLVEMLNLNHFNHIKEVVRVTARKMISFSEKVRVCVEEKYKEILSDKKPSLTSLKILILRELSLIMNRNPERKLSRNFIKIINATELDMSANKQIENEKTMKLEAKRKRKEEYKKKKNDKENPPSKKKKLEDEKKEQKMLQKEVKKDMEESAATHDAKLIAKNNSEILAKLFYMYFKVLKSNKPSVFFVDALNGILKYIHYINVEMIWSILEALKESAAVIREFQKREKKNVKPDQQQMSLMELRLMVVYTAEEIINGPGLLFDIDEKEVLQCFYQILIDISLQKQTKSAGEKNEQQPLLTDKEEVLLVKLLDKIFLVKRQFSVESVASFVKKVVEIVAKHGEKSRKGFNYTLIFIINKIITKYSRLNRMLDPENEGLGLQSYNQAIEDPQATNALNSCLFQEFDQIEKQKNVMQDLKSLVQRLKKEERMLASLATLSPMDVYEKHKSLV